MRQKPRYRRMLPHIHLPEKDYSLVYRLAGSLPRSIIQEIQQEYQYSLREIEHNQTGSERKKSVIELREAIQKKYDRYLDQAKYGPTWLARPEIAQIVKDSIHYIEEKFGFWKVWAYCIMSNHVHLEVTLEPKAPLLQVIMQRHKGFTANQSNRRLERTGPFWQAETFDRFIRNEHDFFRRILYTLNNPVKAGLVEHWQEWPHIYICPSIQQEITGIRAEHGPPGP